jgi:diacylglycerol kinase family enzyme
MAVLGGSHAGKVGVLHVRAREFRFECDPPVDLQVDGDVAGRTPAEVRIAPMALSVMVPAP